MTVEFTLLMPCRNEAETLAACIRKAHQGAAGAKISKYEILIADNGSTDGSQAIASAEGARVVPVKALGYGSALRGGISQAQGKFVIMGDADDSYDWSNIQLFVDDLRAGSGFVNGTRLKGTIMPGAMPFLHRWLGNPILTAIGNILFGTRLSDYHCGLRGFRRAVIPQLNLKTSGMEFATEIIAKTALSGISIKEIPIIYHPDGRTRKPHLRTWQDGWRHLSFMLAISPNWLLLYPGLALFLAGLMGMILLLPGSLTIGQITFDVTTLLVSSLLLMIGVELITLWLIARLFSSTVGLLPDLPWVSTLTIGNKINKGLLTGVILVILGVIPFLFSVQQWIQTGLGALDYHVTFRLVIPSLTLMTLGIHIFFASFVLALINLEHGEWA